jgi:hypothetical protein
MDVVLIKSSLTFDGVSVSFFDTVEGKEPVREALAKELDVRESQVVITNVTSPRTSTRKLGTRCSSVDCSPNATGYTRYQGRACGGRNEICIGDEEPCSSANTVGACKAVCDAADSCTSFEFTMHSSNCQASTSCTKEYSSTTWVDETLYTKLTSSTTAAPTPSPTTAIALVEYQVVMESGSHAQINATMVKIEAGLAPRTFNDASPSFTDAIVSPSKNSSIETATRVSSMVFTMLHSDNQDMQESARVLGQTQRYEGPALELPDGDIGSTEAAVTNWWPPSDGDIASIVIGGLIGGVIAAVAVARRRRQQVPPISEGGEARTDLSSEAGAEASVDVDVSAPHKNPMYPHGSAEAEDDRLSTSSALSTFSSARSVADI